VLSIVIFILKIRSQGPVLSLKGAHRGGEMKKIILGLCVIVWAIVILVQMIPKQAGMLRHFTSQWVWRNE